MDRTWLGTSRTGRMIGALFALILVVSLHSRPSAAVTPIPGGEIAGKERGGAQGGDGLQEISHPAAAGYDGRGGTVVLLDTGVDYTRPEFGSCAKPGKGCQVIAAVDIAPADGQADDSGHGTWTAAILASVAPAAKIISLDVFDGGAVYDNDVAGALQWVLRNRVRYDISVVNMSVGHYREYHAQDCRGSILDAPIAAIRAAGNQGTFGRKFTPGVSFPACVPGVVSVGAVYISSGDTVTYDDGWMKCRDATVTADEPACFSQSASNLDVWAPGAFVSAGPWVGGYGTSAAAPFVAGAAAVLVQAAPHATVAQIQGAITSAGPIVRDLRLRTLSRAHRLDIGGAVAAIQA